MFVRQNIRSLAHHRLPLIYCMDGMIKHGIDDAVDQIFRIIEWLCGGRAKRYCHLVNAPPRSSAAAARSFTVPLRSEEHTSELQSLMRISYAVFCLKKKTKHIIHSQH